MSHVPPGRGVFCNRTLNMRNIRAIGYDMDYTLVHYHEEAWEKRAYEHVRARFSALGWPVDELQFDGRMVVRGLVLDLELGNIVKANRFGFVRHAKHGTRELPYATMKEIYARVLVDLSEPRWVFLNTLFSLSEGCIFAQLVDLLDAGRLPGPMGYADLYGVVRDNLEGTHVEGKLKAEVIGDPERYVYLDEETPLALLDQKMAGKKLLLITNSEWGYTSAMMTYTFDRFLPPGGWRALFDMVIVGARKPDFFTGTAPFFEVVTDEGLLRPGGPEQATGNAFLGGSAARLERALGMSGDELLYVGDHMFGDVRATKRVLRWRTALVLRELETEIDAIEAFRAVEADLANRMREKQILEAQSAFARLALQRRRGGYGPQPSETEAELERRAGELRESIAALDVLIAPMARAAAQLHHPHWGLLTRAGNDKSHLMRQIERYADIYTSRVSNFLHATPYVYLRGPHSRMPHDP